MLSENPLKWLELTSIDWMVRRQGLNLLEAPATQVQ